MKNKSVFKLGTSIVAAFALTQAASAVMIDGEIAFDGSVSLDQPIPSATEFVSFTEVEVSTGTQSGAYLGTAGSMVSMEPLQFDPYVTPTNPLWSFMSGGMTYSFDFMSLSTVGSAPLANGLFRLDLAGTGMAYITGYDPTPGAFSITTTGNARATDLGFGAFTFSTATEGPSTVPDSSTTFALFGMGILGLVGFRARSRRKA